MIDYDLTERAVQDIASARDWYDRRRIDLGNKFLDTVLASIAAARERPTSGPEVRRGVRAVLCRRFPYRVYFEVKPDRIIVLAVYHTARDPHKWDDPQRD